MFFIAKASSSESCVAYSCRVSFHCKQFLAYIDFDDLDTLGDYRTAVSEIRMSINLDLSDVSSQFN